jgi:hypothetical protein
MSQATIDAVRGWASLFGARTIYRAKRGFGQADMDIAVVVQRQIPSSRAGVMFTIEPASGELDKLVIEGAFGLGESVVSGSVSPDRYVVGKQKLNDLAIAQDLARVGGADDAGDAELARDDRRVAGHPAGVGDDHRRAAHQGNPVGRSHMDDEHLAVSQLGAPAERGDHPYRAGRDTGRRAEPAEQRLLLRAATADPGGM